MDPIYSGLMITFATLLALLKPLLMPLIALTVTVLVKSVQPQEQPIVLLVPLQNFYITESVKQLALLILIPLEVSVLIATQPVLLAQDLLLPSV